MFVMSIKLSKKRMLGVLAAVCLVVAAVCTIAPRIESGVLNNNVSNSAKTTQQQVEFLGNFGYEVSEQPVLVQEVILPSEFDDTYTKYNEMQNISGFDLAKFKGQRVKKYTYKVNNYTDSEQEVVANILVQNDKVIGGDISSTTLGGFIHGLIKE